ncbi:MAG: PD40 domain-containing protein [Bryobacterales bacterium]|nr:PD40 domain-containing protein [Bryobacterales bacterium]
MKPSSPLLKTVVYARTGHAAILLALAVGAAFGEPQRSRPPARQERTRQPDDDPCSVRELRKSDIQGFKVYSPDGSRYVINKEDEHGTAQIYLGGDGKPGLTCITCEERPNGPKRKRFKMQPRWHPSGRWLFLAVERDKFSAPPILGWSRKYVEGQLQNGIFTNMYAVSLDGKQWHRLTDFKSGVKGTPDGYTGPAITRDGRKAVWSQIVDGNVLKYSFGRWQLMLADFEERNGAPALVNRRDITPKGMHWNEPGSFHPDNETVLFTGSTQKDAQGMDIHTLNIRTGAVKNLTNSPTVWDEHGVWSPDGRKVLFMSAHPYRDDPKASKIMSIKTEFMLLDAETGDLRQLTHFKEKGYPEYGAGIAANGDWSPDGRSLSLNRLVFPNYEYWDIHFQGACGNQPLR